MSTVQEQDLQRQERFEDELIMDLERDYLLQNYARYPLVLDRGRGCYVFDPSGKRYLDFITGIGVNALGYSHPRLTKVIREQAGLLLPRCLNASRLP